MHTWLNSFWQTHRRGRVDIHGIRIVPEVARDLDTEVRAVEILLPSITHGLASRADVRASEVLRDALRAEGALLAAVSVTSGRAAVRTPHDCLAMLLSGGAAVKTSLCNLGLEAVRGLNG